MNRLLTLLTLASLAAAPAAAQPPKPPTIEFATESLQALTAVSGEAGLKWQSITTKKPVAVLKAIAAAEKLGWKPTSTSLFEKRGTPRKAGRIRPIASGDEYFSNGDGEFLVWDWDDGNPDTAEGTVWARSYHTGAEVMYNVQIAGGTYDASWTSVYEVVEVTVDGLTAYSGMTYRGDESSLPASFVRAKFAPCTAEQYSRFVFDCQVAAGRERLRDGMRGAAVGAGVGGTWGASTGGLAGAVAGAVSGGATGFVGGVISSFIWGSDYDCYDGAWERCQAPDIQLTRSVGDTPKRLKGVLHQ